MSPVVVQVLQLNLMRVPIAAILLSNLSIMVTTTDISELVTWEVGPETPVAGEGDRPIVVDGRGVVTGGGIIGA